MECIFSIEVMVLGYQQYKDVWDAPVSEILQYEREVGNVHDTFVVAVLKDDSIVGHCPRKFQLYALSL